MTLDHNVARRRERTLCLLILLHVHLSVLHLLLLLLHSLFFTHIHKVFQTFSRQ